MNFHQRVFASIASILIMLLVLELVRRRKLREEYSWLWLLTGVIIILLVAWYDLLVFISRTIGAVMPTTTLFIFGLLFLMIISLHYSVQISKLSKQVKVLAQELTLLKGQVQQEGDVGKSEGRISPYQLP